MTWGPCNLNGSAHGPLTRYAQLRVAHAPAMPGTFSPPPLVSDPDMHHGTCLTHVPWCMPGSLTSDFLWNRWRGKHSRRMRNPQFCVSGKRPNEAYMYHLASMGWVACLVINLCTSIPECFQWWCQSLMHALSNEKQLILSIMLAV